jgi:pimeloyl-ACP methyl ester carboxylesterase
MAEIVDFITPHKVLLTGLLLGNKKANTTYIFIHGLGGNFFSMREIGELLVNETTNVLLFNNRGHDIISRISKVDNRKKKGRKSFLAGAAHEIFTDCVDDIEGAVEFVKSLNSKRIILVGHSTGSQKAVYYATRKQNQNKLTGIVLLSPLSDFAGILKQVSLEDFENLLKISKALVDQETPHTLLPNSIWPQTTDAQRFLSLYTPTSEEEIFSYVTPGKQTIYSKIKIPLLVILGEKDEYRDRPVKQILKWFDLHQNSKQFISCQIPNATHGFDGHEQQLRKIIEDWLNS